MFFLSNTAYSVAPDGVLTDWSNVTELLKPRKGRKKKNKRLGLIVYLSYCFYRTNVNDFFFLLLFLFMFAYLLFLFVWGFFSVETWSFLPCLHMLHVQQHYSDSQTLLLRVRILVSRLLAIKIKARYCINMAFFALSDLLR